MSTEAEILERLNAVAGRPDRNMAALVVQAMDNDTRKDGKILRPEKCVLTACSRTGEELARWRFMTDPQMADRSIEAARNVVTGYLRKMGITRPNWNMIGEQVLLAGKPPMGNEERERNAWRMTVLREWQANGKMQQRDEHGNYRYTLEDCKAEAARRQEAENAD